VLLPNSPEVIEPGRQQSYSPKHHSSFSACIVWYWISSLYPDHASITLIIHTTTSPIGFCITNRILCPIRLSSKHLRDEQHAQCNPYTRHDLHHLSTKLLLSDQCGYLTPAQARLDLCAAYHRATHPIIPTRPLAHTAGMSSFIFYRSSLFIALK